MTIRWPASRRGVGLSDLDTDKRDFPANGAGPAYAPGERVPRITADPSFPESGPPRGGDATPGIINALLASGKVHGGGASPPFSISVPAALQVVQQGLPPCPDVAAPSTYEGRRAPPRVAGKGKGCWIPGSSRGKTRMRGVSSAQMPRTPVQSQPPSGPCRGTEDPRGRIGCRARNDPRTTTVARRETVELRKDVLTYASATL